MENTNRVHISILVIDESVPQTDRIRENFSARLPDNCSFDVALGLKAGLDLLKKGKFFDIVVLGTDYRDTDGKIKRRVKRIRQLLDKPTKVVLFAAAPPDNPVPLGVNHIVDKYQYRKLADAVDRIAKFCNDDAEDPVAVELRGWAVPL